MNAVVWCVCVCVCVCTTSVRSKEVSTSAFVKMCTSRFFQKMSTSHGKRTKQTTKIFARRNLGCDFVMMNITTVNVCDDKKSVRRRRGRMCTRFLLVVVIHARVLDLAQVHVVILPGFFQIAELGVHIRDGSDGVHVARVIFNRFGNIENFFHVFNRV